MRRRRGPTPDHERIRTREAIENLIFGFAVDLERKLCGGRAPSARSDAGVFGGGALLLGGGALVLDGGALVLGSGALIHGSGAPILCSGALDIRALPASRPAAQNEASDLEWRPACRAGPTRMAADCEVHTGREHQRAAAASTAPMPWNCVTGRADRAVNCYGAGTGRAG